MHTSSLAIITSCLRPDLASLIKLVHQECAYADSARAIRAHAHSAKNSSSIEMELVQWKRTYNRKKDSPPTSIEKRRTIGSPETSDYPN